MSKRQINPRASKSVSETITNVKGASVYKVGDPIKNLKIAAASCFFGEPMYYEGANAKPCADIERSWYYAEDYTQRHYDSSLGSKIPAHWHGLSANEMLELAIDEALDYDPRETLRVAADLRQIDNIRTTPQVILVRAAHHPKVKGTGMLRIYAEKIMYRADEPTVALAYHMYRFKDQPLPNSLKKVMKHRLENFKEYHLTKYSLQKRQVKLVDTINLVHPKSEAIDKFMKGEISSAGNTWESIISNGGTWEEAFEVMGHMALLRNIRNLISKSSVSHIDIASKLAAGVSEGRQLPFRYYTAYQQLKEFEGVSGTILDALSGCLNLSLQHLPKLEGNILSVADNSGSMTFANVSEYSSVSMMDMANLMCAISALRAEGGGDAATFGDSYKSFTVNPRSDVFDLCDKVEQMGRTTGHGTNIGTMFDHLFRTKKSYDNVIVYSDMQMAALDRFGNGGLVTHIKRYHKDINPNTNFFFVQMAGYQDSPIPDCWDRVYYCGSWSGQFLHFVKRMIDLG